MNGADVRVVTRLATLSCFSLILFLFEALAPRILPWMKLGLGNMVTLFALLGYGIPAALAVAGIKLLVGGLIGGTLAGPAFVVGGGAGLASLMVMAAAHRFAKKAFSIVGLSILGALSHQLVQLALASAYIGIEGLSHFLPLFLTWGLASGAVVGLTLYWVVEKLRSNGWMSMSA